VRDRIPNQSKSALKSFTGTEVERAIYVDYEGVPWKAPVFVGWLVDGEYAGAIIDRAFDDCAYRYRAKEVGRTANDDFASRLLTKARTEKRHIVAWSQHDKKILWDVLASSQHAEFQGTFVNAIKLGRPWHAANFGPGLRRGHARLCYFAAAFGQRVPPKYGDKVVGRSLSAVGKGLPDLGSYANLESKHRQAWVTAVKHNKWDVDLTQRVCRLVVAGAPPTPGFLPPPEAMSSPPSDA